MAGHGGPLHAKWWGRCSIVPVRETRMDPQQILSPSDTFVHRHIGPTDADIQEMLATLGFQSLDALLSATVPDDIRLRAPLALGPHRGEYDVLADLRSLHDRNKIFRSFLGMGYHDCPTPPVIQRNILENPGWYTQYTPYQPEIAQGRLEALLNFQTLVADLTGLPLANASLLDEATAAAEAMAMCRSIAHKDQDRSSGKDRFFVAEDCHPQTIAVLRTRAHPLGIALQIGRTDQIDLSDRQLFGVLLQYPTTDGVAREYSDLVTRAHAEGALVAVATDLLALTLLRPPGEFGADIAIGSSQRFGVSLGFGDPMPRSSRRRTNTSAISRGASSGCRRTPRGSPRTGLRCRRANSTSAATRRRATSVRRRCCWRSWPACLRSITGLRGCGGSRNASTPCRRCWPRDCDGSATPSAVSRSSIRCGSDQPPNQPISPWIGSWRARMNAA